jgi:hypothetical protein
MINYHRSSVRTPPKRAEAEDFDQFVKAFRSGRLEALEGV